VAVEDPGHAASLPGARRDNKSFAAPERPLLPAARQAESPSASGPSSQAQGKAQGKAQAQAQVQEEAVSISERADLGHTRGSKVVPVPGGEPETAQAKAAPGVPAQGSAAAREGAHQVEASGNAAAKQSAGAGTGAREGAAGPKGGSESGEGALLGWGADLIGKSSPPDKASELAQQPQQGQGESDSLRAKDGVVWGRVEGAEEGVEGTESAT